jgi:hypothetical protein
MKSVAIGIMLVSILLTLSFGLALAQNEGEAMNMTALQAMTNATENATIPQGLLENGEAPHVLNIILSNVSLSITGIQNLTVVTNNIDIVPNEANATNNSTKAGMLPTLLNAMS